MYAQADATGHLQQLLQIWHWTKETFDGIRCTDPAGVRVYVNGCVHSCVYVHKCECICLCRGCVSVYLCVGLHVCVSMSDTRLCMSTYCNVGAHIRFAYCNHSHNAKVLLYAYKLPFVPANNLFPSFPMKF